MEFDPLHAWTQPQEEPPQADVLLVSMPFGPLSGPSLGLSLLKAETAPLGISAHVLYFTLSFADQIGAAIYSRIADGYPSTTALVGEWIFSAALFETDRSDAEAYIDDILCGKSAGPGDFRIKLLPASFIRDIRHVRRAVRPFLDDCLEEVLSWRPRIVGFTSVFQQHAASLALAKRVKAELPETTIVFGGANCEAVMGLELLRQFSFVDAVVSGEGDLVFPQLVLRILAGDSISTLPGVYTRANLEMVAAMDSPPHAPLLADLDSLPFPDYRDFMEQYQAAELDVPEKPQLTFETSRGCWWGEKKHCTFCGLNGATLTYRRKSPARVMEELERLAVLCPDSIVAASDNVLSMSYFKDLLPELAEQQLPLDLFYEVKANLKKEQVRLLREAGIMTIQPGIESLSNEVLERMGKGTSRLQNIQVLKWCKEMGIEAKWNILWGFPGETPEEYGRMAETIPLLTHLQPPVGGGAIRLDRFSPNFDHALELGFVQVEPCPAYRYVYPFAPEVLSNLAYFFTFGYRAPHDVTGYTKPVEDQISAWHSAHRTSDLFSVDKGTHLLIWDLRPVASSPLRALQSLQRVLYIAADRIQSVQELQAQIQDLTVPEIRQLLHPLVESGLMLQEGNRYLSLAVPLGHYVPSRPVLKRLKQILDTFPQSSEGETIIALEGDMWPEIQVQIRAEQRTSRLTAEQFHITPDGRLVIRNRDIAAVIERAPEGADRLARSRLLQFMDLLPSITR